MAVTTDSLIEVAVNCSYAGQQVLNVWQYRVGAAVLAPNLAQIIEGWWNTVRSAYRGIYTNTLTNYFKTIKGRELNNPAGDFAEYNVQAGDTGGTRAGGSPNEMMPIFVSAGVRLTVGTRATRPGQKRFGPLHEGDVANGVLQAQLITPLQTFMGEMVLDITCMGPALGTVLHPIVCRKDLAGAVTASQAPTGYLINTNATTQNTRKIGRGA